MAAWGVVAGVVMVVWWVPVSARIPMVTAIATSTPSAVITVPGRIRRRGVTRAMVCGVDMVCSVVVGRWAAGRLDGCLELGRGTVTGAACSGLTARLQVACDRGPGAGGRGRRRLVGSRGCLPQRGG